MRLAPLAAELVLRILISILLILTLMPTFVLASEGDWQVAKTTQQVNYTLDKQGWNAVRTGDIIPNNAWISTGPKGRVQLTRGVESLSFQPNTLAGIFTSGTNDRKTEVVQQKGVLDLEIEKRDHPHTTVQTPFLAAVVKGTKFRVSVTKSAAAVSVNRGLVQVTSFASGQRSNVAAGQSASVDSVKGMTVAGVTTAPSIAAVAPSIARVSAVGTTSLSGAAATTSEPSASPESSVSSPAGTTGVKSGTGSGSNTSSPDSSDDDKSGGAGTGGDVKPGKPSDPAKPGKPGDPGKPGKPSDPDKPGKPDDKGKPGKDDDKDKPGKPDDKGKPGKDNHKGKPGKP